MSASSRYSARSDGGVVGLCGAGLGPAETAASVARRKELYEILHPDTKSVTERGGPGRGNNGRQIGEGFSERFTADTAERTGRSERRIMRAD